MGSTPIILSPTIQIIHTYVSMQAALRPQLNTHRFQTAFHTSMRRVGYGL